MLDTVVRCAACDGYGWIDDEETHAEIECKWCGGIGYVYRDERGVSRRIPESDYTALADTLERLEVERLREIGYTGAPKKPWEQEIRKNKT
ncbi:MAG: hypothetical protein IAE80_27965 [Anaerolinea sp.]|nr:hypothetical protein [Anaerolinea sp.]